MWFPIQIVCVDGGGGLRSRGAHLQRCRRLAIARFTNVWWTRPARRYRRSRCGDLRRCASLTGLKYWSTTERWPDGGFGNNRGDASYFAGAPDPGVAVSLAQEKQRFAAGFVLRSGTEEMDCV